MTVLDNWGIHPKGHRCHKCDVTQMFQSLRSHWNMGCIWTVKEIRTQPICAHSDHHNWQLLRCMAQCMCTDDKNLFIGEDCDNDGYYCGCILRKISTSFTVLYSFVHSPCIGSAVIQGMAWWKYVNWHNLFSFQSSSINVMPCKDWDTWYSFGNVPISMK